MFERHAEDARRALFFARYEATQSGSSVIETEHLLLGVLREGRDLERLLKACGVSVSVLREDIARRTVPRAPLFTADELPLSAETTRAVRWAEEEADRLDQSLVGSEHLLLGLLREDDSVAAAVLFDHGVTAAAVRQLLARLAEEARAVERSYDVRITPTKRDIQEGTSGIQDLDSWTLEGFFLNTLLARMYGVPETRIEWPAAMDALGRYDFVLRLPKDVPADDGPELMDRLMREGIERHFDITIRREPRAMDVYVATTVDGDIRGVKESNEPGGGQLMAISFDDEDWAEGTEPTPDELRELAEARFKARFRSFSADRGGAYSAIRTLSGTSGVDQFCRMIEGGLGRPVVDETGLTGTYRVDLRTEADTIEGLLQALRDQLGLMLTPDRREVTLLIVRPR